MLPRLRAQALLPIAPTWRLPCLAGKPRAWLPCSRCRPPTSRGRQPLRYGVPVVWVWGAAYVMVAGLHVAYAMVTGLRGGCQEALIP